MLEQYGIDQSEFDDMSKDKDPLLKETLNHISKNSLLSKTMLKMKSVLIEHDTLQMQQKLKEQ